MNMKYLVTSVAAAALLLVALAGLLANELVHLLRRGFG